MERDWLNRRRSFGRTRRIARVLDPAAAERPMQIDQAS
jgi:hypothetical protein